MNQTIPAYEAGLVPGYLWWARIRTAHGATLQTLRGYLAADRQLTPAMLEDLAAKHELYLDVEIAQHPNTPRHVLDDLLANGATSVQSAVVDRLTDPDELALLATSTKPAIRRAVASNPHTTPAVLLDMATRRSAVKHLLKNPNTPPDALVVLGRDMQLWNFATKNLKFNVLIRNLFRDRETGANLRQVMLLRDGVAADPDWLVDLLNRLPQVARVVLANPGCPLYVVEQYLGEHVCQASIVRHPGCKAEWLEQLASSNNGTVLEWIPFHENCPLPVIESLVHTTRVKVKRHVLRSPYVPRELLLDHVSAVGSELRDGVARNPACPQEALARLVHDTSVHVAKRALQHPNLPLAALEAMPLQRLLSIGVGGQQMPSLPAEAALTVVPLARAWLQSFGELVSAQQLLAA